MPQVLLEEDYTIFIHLRDSQNNTVVNADHQPYHGLVLTTSWPIGKTIKETVRLTVPYDLSSGAYDIIIGMYSLETLERLPVIDATGGDEIILEQITLN